MIFSISQMTMRLIFRMHHEGSSGDARAEPYNQNRLRIGVNQCGKIPQHALQAHIERLCRCLYFAADVKINLPRVIGRR